MARERTKPDPLWNPSGALKIAGWISAIIAFVVSVIGLARDDWSYLSSWLFPDGRIVNPLTLVLVVVLTNAATFALLYIALFKERMRRREEVDRTNNLRLHLDDIERERLLDLKTGVPNEKKLMNDFRLLKNTNLPELQAQLILIDIDDFGSVNTKFGHQKGNEIIRLIAQSIFQGMRRDEEIYTPRDAELYRPFTGGDEFIFLVRGKQYEAVGFATRLHQRLEKLSDETESILGSRFDIDFHGAIAPIYPRDDYADAVQRLEQCFVKAKEEGSRCRVFWWKREETKYPEGDFRRTLYDRAINRFCLPEESPPGPGHAAEDGKSLSQQGG